MISQYLKWFFLWLHTGAGWSVLVLYKVEPSGQVWRLDGDLLSFALDHILADMRGTKKQYSNISSDDYFHISADPMMSWNRDSSLLHFQIFATPRQDRPEIAAYPRVERWVDYNPKEHKLVLR
jgi:hypothetical protein